MAADDPLEGSASVGEGQLSASASADSAEDLAIARLDRRRADLARLTDGWTMGEIVRSYPATHEGREDYEDDKMLLAEQAYVGSRIGSGDSLTATFQNSPSPATPLVSRPMNVRFVSSHLGYSAKGQLITWGAFPAALLVASLASEYTAPVRWLVFLIGWIPAAVWLAGKAAGPDRWPWFYRQPGTVAFSPEGIDLISEMPGTPKESHVDWVDVGGVARKGGGSAWSIGMMAWSLVSGRICIDCDRSTARRTGPSPRFSSPTDHPSSS